MVICYFVPLCEAVHFFMILNTNSYSPEKSIISLCFLCNLHIGPFLASFAKSCLYFHDANRDSPLLANESEKANIVHSNAQRHEQIKYFKEELN